MKTKVRAFHKRGLYEAINLPGNGRKLWMLVPQSTLLLPKPSKLKTPISRNQFLGLRTHWVICAVVIRNVITKQPSATLDNLIDNTTRDLIQYSPSLFLEEKVFIGDLSTMASFILVPEQHKKKMQAHLPTSVFEKLQFRNLFFNS